MPLYNGKEMSKQRKYQLKHIAEGKCRLCHRAVSHLNKELCDLHRIKLNVIKRERTLDQRHLSLSARNQRENGLDLRWVE